MSDPFDAVTPIGVPKEPAHLAAISQRERRMRAKADHSAVPEPARLTSTGADGQPKPPGKPRAKLVPNMTTDEAKAMAERMIDLLATEAIVPDGEAE